jgi:hypothetical protein
MNDLATQLDLVNDIEARHDDLLLRIAELDKRVEKALADSQIYRIKPQTAQSRDAAA